MLSLGRSYQCFLGWRRLVSVQKILKKNWVVFRSNKGFTFDCSLVGGINERELLRTFNCGIGAILIVSAQEANNVLSLIQGEKSAIIGCVEPYSPGIY